MLPIHIQTLEFGGHHEESPLHRELDVLNEHLLPFCICQSGFFSFHYLTLLARPSRPSIVENWMAKPFMFPWSLRTWKQHEKPPCFCCSTMKPTRKRWRVENFNGTFVYFCWNSNHPNRCVDAFGFGLYLDLGSYRHRQSIWQLLHCMSSDTTKLSTSGSYRRV